MTMSKAVLMSIQPYWVFLIIAKSMGWDTFREKTLEVRKSFPKDESWNKVAKIYCSKDKKSFNKIPKEYQPFMKPLLGKVIGEFVCGEVYFKNCDIHDFDTITLEELSELSSVTQDDLLKYADRGNLYGWHISNLIIYDEPKELSEFKKINQPCWYGEMGISKRDCQECKSKDCFIQRPPQSWCYVEEV